MNTVRFTHEGQDAAQTLNTRGLESANQVSDGIVTSGKTTLAGLGQDSEGAQGLIAANQAEYERSQIELDAVNAMARNDLQTGDIKDQVGGRVRGALGG